MFIRRVLALLLVCAPAACAPVVTHGPRPERGLQGTFTLGLPHDACDTSCGFEFVPQYGAGLRYGGPAEDGRFGYSVGSTVSLSFVSTDVDLYLQAPTAPEWAVGAGVLASSVYVMPYVQAGRMRADGAGLYTTQGFAWLAERSNHLGFFPETTEMVTPRYWSPTVAYRFAHRGGAVHVYVSGAFGSARFENIDLPSDVRPPPRREPVRYLTAGITLETDIPTPIRLGP